MSADTRGAGGPSQSGDVPTCYRHPDRETYVSCSRCGRSVCPDCMNDAVVGFHCPECVQEGNRTTREGRTVFGGRISEGLRVTWVLLVANVAVYILQQLASGVTLMLAMRPVNVASGEFYRLITAAFLHAPGSILHIAFNMWALFILGRPMEDALGRLRFATLYLLSALGGSVLGYLVAPPGLASIGASGAIFGLFGATFVVAKRLRIDTRWILGLLAINLVLTFVVPGIDWRAHIGGLITGAALAVAFAYAPRARRTLVHVGAGVGLAALLAIGVVLRTLMLT